MLPSYSRFECLSSMTLPAGSPSPPPYGNTTGFAKLPPSADTQRSKAENIFSDSRKRQKVRNRENQTSKRDDYDVEL